LIIDRVASLLHELDSKASAYECLSLQFFEGWSTQRQIEDQETQKIERQFRAVIDTKIGIYRDT